MTSEIKQRQKSALAARDDLLQAADALLEAAMERGYVPRGRVRKPFYQVRTAALDALHLAAAQALDAKIEGAK